MDKRSLLWRDGMQEDRSGMHFPVHYYVHPNTGKQVILAGMSHCGEPVYFEEVKNILSACDFVLFENMMPGVRYQTVREAWLKWLYKNFNNNMSAEKAFPVLWEEFWHLIVHLYHPVLLGEREVFEKVHEIPNWILADTVTRESFSEDNAILFDRMQLFIPAAFKERCVNSFRWLVGRASEGMLIKRDLRRVFAVFGSYPMSWMDQATYPDWGLGRDFYCFT